MRFWKVDYNKYMAFFSQKKEDETKKQVVVSKKKKATKTALSAPTKNAEFANVLLRPMVTEKVHRLSTQGQYAFFSDVRATKLHIKRAIEQIYGVHVESVSTLQVKPKKRIRGKDVGFTKRMKKVIVSLRKGEKITLFEGV